MSLTEKERYDLTIEMLSCRATVGELSKQDARMDTKVDTMCRELEDKATRIEHQLGE